MTTAAKRMELAKNNILTAERLVTALLVTNDNAAGYLSNKLLDLSIRLYRTIMERPFNGCLLTRSYE